MVLSSPDESDVDNALGGVVVRRVVGSGVVVLRVVVVGYGVVVRRVVVARVVVRRVVGYGVVCDVVDVVDFWGGLVLTVGRCVVGRVVVALCVVGLRVVRGLCVDCWRVGT